MPVITVVFAILSAVVVFIIAAVTIGREARRLDARDVVIAIGGPTGLPDEVLERADEVLSLGPETIAHQLARIVLLEQLFRASKILAGEPYHL